jgi:hypothetical protein
MCSDESFQSIHLFVLTDGLTDYFLKNRTYVEKLHHFKCCIWKIDFIDLSSSVLKSVESYV